MKSVAVLFAFLALASATSPASKVMQMLGDLEAKIIKEGEEAQKTYDEFTEWCEDRSRNVGFEIKTSKAEIEELKAAIEKETAKASSLTTKIEELVDGIAKDEADLKAATGIRESEAADYAAESKELKEVISTLERAIAVLTREMAKNPAAMLQYKSTGDIAKALSAMVQASMLSSADASRLTALVQTKGQESEEDDDTDPGAPAAAVYKGHADGIIGVLEDLLDKAEGNLESAQKTETTSQHNYEMLKQSLEDEIEYANKDMSEAKDGLAASQEAKATAEGDLSVTEKDLAEDEDTLKTLHGDCMKGADEFQAGTKSRGEELTALAEAKKILKEAAGAAAQEYGAASFIQLSRSKLYTGADLAKFEAVRFIRDLARKESSVLLAQLASQMSSAIRFGQSSGADPFAKVKSLISNMISKLEEDAASDASQKAYCDKETSETKQKKLEKEYEISKLSTKIDSMSAKSAKLKSEVAALQKELAELAASQAEMDKIRSEEKALYEKNSAEMKQGIDAVKQALSVLKDYYASEGKSHNAASGAGGGIISMLEVVESDFTKSLANMEVTESDAVAEYEKVTYMNKIATTSKGQDVKYKTKEAAALDKSSAEAVSDREGVQTELDALLEYLAKLDKMCVAKAEPYAERKRRRDEEIAGLKQALEILEGEAVLIQEKTKRGLRGSA